MMCAAVLAFECVVLGLSSIVLITIEDISVPTGLAIGLGLAVAAILIAGLLRFEWAYYAGFVAPGGGARARYRRTRHDRAGPRLRRLVDDRLRARPEDRARAGSPRLRPAGLVRVLRMTQRTLVLLKPDTVRRGLVGEVLSRFEAKGLTIVAMDLRTITAELADRHYAEHVSKDFYPPLRDFVLSGPLVALVLEGDEAVEVVRAAQRGHRRPEGGAGHHPGRPEPANRENLVHGSDSVESAEREIAIWFPGAVSAWGPGGSGRCARRAGRPTQQRCAAKALGRPWPPTPNAAVVAVGAAGSARSRS